MKYLILPFAILAFALSIYQCGNSNSRENNKNNDNSGIVIDDLDTAVAEPALIVRSSNIVTDDLDAALIPVYPSRDTTVTTEPDSLRDAHVLILGPGGAFSAAEMRIVTAPENATITRTSDSLTVSHPALLQSVSAGNNGAFFAVPIVVGTDTLTILIRKKILAQSSQND